MYEVPIEESRMKSSNNKSIVVTVLYPLLIRRGDAAAEEENTALSTVTNNYGCQPRDMHSPNLRNLQYRCIDTFR